MRCEVLDGPEEVAREGARRIADEARAAVASRGVFHLAVSGGSTPWRMLGLLAEEPDGALPWDRIHLFQVDERQAPAGHADRNWTHVSRCLLERGLLPAGNRHPMPVESEDLDAAARRYEVLLEREAGRPPILDLVHLGLGADGHTASLVPGDPVLDVGDRDVAPTARPYEGRRRLTLTYPVLGRARRILWVVTGEGKRDALLRLERGDPAIPAGRVRRERAWLLADRAAAGAR